jgi:hypothetical protein
MTTTPATALDRIGQGNDSPAAVAERIGQATAVEQARAVAEVQAAIVVAQQCPRDIQAARRQILDSCAQMGLAERAFFRFPRAGQTVSGPSVHLARELARCFGNVQYGISELRRDDDHGQSEMQAWAWDVQNNTRTSHTFIVPHKRDTKKGQTALVDLRDIYENNANNGARRVREAIFAVLPPWLVQEAQDLCSKTLEKGDGEPLQQRIAKAVTAFADLGVPQSLLVKRVGSPVADWSPYDVAQLQVVYTSIRRREVTVEDEFPSAPPVTAAEITEAATKTAPAAQPPAETPAPSGGDESGFDQVRQQVAETGGWPETKQPPAGTDVEEPPYRDDQPPQE